MLKNLPTTLEQYYDQIHGSNIDHSQRFVRSMYDRDIMNDLCDDTQEDEHAIVRSFARRRDNNHQYSPNRRQNTNS